MGAYYEATIGQNRINNSDGGIKLMEHSYVGNAYVNSVMHKLLDNPQSLVWLCDYHEPDDNSKLTWENTELIETSSDDLFDYQFILNHNKKKYIDIHELKTKWIMNEQSTNEWVIHPIPILCNSDTESQGGGDYHKDDERRAIWCGDMISTQDETPSSEFTNVTDDCLFFE